MRTLHDWCNNCKHELKSENCGKCLERTLRENVGLAIAIIKTDKPSFYKRLYPWDDMECHRGDLIYDDGHPICPKCENNYLYTDRDPWQCPECGNIKEIEIADPDIGEEIYQALDEDYKKEHNGKFFCIDVEIRKVVSIGDTPLEAIEKAKEKEDKSYYLRKVGQLPRI